MCLKKGWGYNVTSKVHFDYPLMDTFCIFTISFLSKTQTHTRTVMLRGFKSPFTLLVSRVSRVGLLYTRFTNSGAVCRWLARSNDGTERTQNEDGLL